MAAERILVFEQKNILLNKLADIGDREMLLQKQKIQFQRERHRFHESVDMAAERRSTLELDCAKKMEDLQLREVRLEVDAKAYQLFKDSQAKGKKKNVSETITQTERIQPEGHDYQTSELGPGTYTLGPLIVNTQGCQTVETDLQQENDILGEEVERLKKEKEELANHVEEVKNEISIEKYDLEREKQQHGEQVKQYKEDVRRLSQSQILQEEVFETTSKEIEAEKTTLLNEKNILNGEKDDFEFDKQLLAKHTELLAARAETLQAQITEHLENKQYLFNQLTKNKIPVDPETLELNTEALFPQVA